MPTLPQPQLGEAVRYTDPRFSPAPSTGRARQGLHPSRHLSPDREAVGLSPPAVSDPLHSRHFPGGVPSPGRPVVAGGASMTPSRTTAPGFVGLPSRQDLAPSASPAPPSLASPVIEYPHSTASAAAPRSRTVAEAGAYVRVRRVDGREADLFLSRSERGHSSAPTSVPAPRVFHEPPRQDEGTVAVAHNEQSRRLVEIDRELDNAHGEWVRTNGSTAASARLRELWLKREAAAASLSVTRGPPPPPPLETGRTSESARPWDQSLARREAAVAWDQYGMQAPVSGAAWRRTSTGRVFAESTQSPYWEPVPSLEDHRQHHQPRIAATASPPPPIRGSFKSAPAEAVASPATPLGSARKAAIRPASSQGSARRSSSRRRSSRRRRHHDSPRRSSSRRSRSSSRDRRSSRRSPRRSSRRSHPVRPAPAP
eukprot:Hpha_TRINITY_DN11017_c0_g2::TRINITY_DN11017_c0_g2_i1::g.93048::m.93048